LVKSSVSAFRESKYIICCDLRILIISRRQNNLDMNVKYCIVCSFALAIHPKPRDAKDLDIFVEPSRGNGENLINILVEFGFTNTEIKPEDFTKKIR